MSDDLISRKELRKAFKKSQFFTEVNLYYARQLIDNAQTVDTTCPNCDSGYAQGYSDGYLKGKDERPHGEWIVDTEHSITMTFYKCTNCNYFGGATHYRYCPNCGADMRGGSQ